jgi:pimeloyl-ACP methyl ester carboxylesterase
VKTKESQQALKSFGEVVFPAIAEKYANGDRYGAVAMFYEVTSGIEGARTVVESALPDGAGELAAADLATFLQADGPAMGGWMAAANSAVIQQITTPITWIGGADSPPHFTESHDIFQQWLPTTTSANVPGAGHYFPLLKPADTAAAVSDWLSAHEKGA